MKSQTIQALFATLAFASAAHAQQNVKLAVVTQAKAGVAKLSGQAPVSIGNVTYYGGGCPAGSLSSTPNGGALSLIFSQAYVEVGGEGSPERLQRNCNIVIPITVSPSTEVIALNLDYRGFVYTNYESYAQLNSWVQFADGLKSTNDYPANFFQALRTRDADMTKLFEDVGGEGRDFLVSQKVKLSRGSNIGRGTSMSLIVSLRWSARTTILRDPAGIFVDSTDVQISHR